MAQTCFGSASDARRGILHQKRLQGNQLWCGDCASYPNRSSAFDLFNVCGMPASTARGLRSCFGQPCLPPSAWAEAGNRASSPGRLRSAATWTMSAVLKNELSLSGRAKPGRASGLIACRHTAERVGPAVHASPYADLLSDDHRRRLCRAGKYNRKVRLQVTYGACPAGDVAAGSGDEETSDRHNSKSSHHACGA